MPIQHLRPQTRQPEDDRNELRAYARQPKDTGAEDTGPAVSRLQQATVDRARRFPDRLTHTDVLALQRVVGNRETLRLLTTRNAPRSEETTSAPGGLYVAPALDRSEQEAERVAAADSRPGTGDAAGTRPSTIRPSTIHRMPTDMIQREFDPDESLSTDNYYVMASSRLHSKIRTAILEVIPDEKMVDAYLDSNPLVAQILSGQLKNIPLGRVVYGARVAMQRQQMENAIRAKTFKNSGKDSGKGSTIPPPTKDMALGYTKVPNWTKKQAAIVDKVNKNPSATLTPKEEKHLRKNPKPAEGHKLKDFTGSLATESTWYEEWVHEGLVSQDEYDRGLIAWQVAFDKAATNLLVRGGNIHFDLTGFLPSEIEKLKSVKYWLPYKQETGKGNPTKTFESNYAGPTIGQNTGSTLRSGLRITHWELAQVLYNKNMWDRTTFYINDPISGFKRLTPSEVKGMGVEYLGEDLDYISMVDRTEPN